MENLRIFIIDNINITILLILLIIVYVIFEIYNIIYSVDSLEVEEIIKCINDNTCKIIDVRSKDNYQKNHIIHAINYDFNLLKENNCIKLQKYKNHTIIIYAENCSIDKNVYKFLKTKGFTQVYCIDGGLDMWINKNLPLL